MFAHSLDRSTSPYPRKVACVVLLSRLLAEQPSTAQRLRAHLDTCAAFAFVVLASSATLYAATWLLQGWQLS